LCGNGPGTLLLIALAFVHKRSAKTRALGLDDRGIASSSGPASDLPSDLPSDLTSDQ
jgi:hypothetical protein